MKFYRAREREREGKRETKKDGQVVTKEKERRERKDLGILRS
jgi:hypothetical protein